MRGRRAKALQTLLLLSVVGVSTATEPLSVATTSEDLQQKNKVRMAMQRLMERTCIDSSISDEDESYIEQQLEDDWKLLIQELLDDSSRDEVIDSMIERFESRHDANAGTATRTSTLNVAPIADRQLQGMMDTYDDPDCTEREFDLNLSNSDDNINFTVDEAVQVFQKCRILVLRNVYSSGTVQKTLPKFSEYVRNIDQGRIPSEGTTTYGGDFFILREDTHRYNYMLTQQMVKQAADIFANPTILNILSHPAILGSDMILNHAGTINSWSTPSREPQYWHIDGEYVHHHDNESDDEGPVDYLLSDNTIGGHDLAPFAINLFTPLLNLTHTHGPTEFCVGTSWLRGEGRHGVNGEHHENMEIVHQLLDFEWQVKHGREPPKCPTSRIPLLNMGDVVLFDYMVSHRGGANQSRELRSLLFAMYSRKWFRDTTFDNDDDDECNDPDDTQQCELEYLTKLTRFAVPVEGYDGAEDEL